MLKDKSIHPHQIKFDYAITRIEVDSYTSNLWITHNDTEDSIHFFKITLEEETKTKKLDFTFKKKDFILNKVYNDFLILSKIVDPGKPDENEFFIVDAESEKIIESYKGFRFIGFLNDSEIQIEKPGFETINRETVNLDKYRRSSHLKPSNFFQPQLFLQKNELFNNIKKFLLDRMKADILAPIELLEHNDSIFISVHCKENQALTKYLLIINNEGELIFETKLYEKLQKRMPDSFFVSSNFLIFVSRFNVLNILNINPHNAR